MTSLLPVFCQCENHCFGYPYPGYHFTRDLGMGIPKTRGYPNPCDSALRDNVSQEKETGVRRMGVRRSRATIHVFDASHHAIIPVFGDSKF